MKSSKVYKDEVENQGRVIARGFEDLKVERARNMAKAAKRHQTMLEKAADRVLAGGVQR
jgi:hypothetical protein